MNIMKIIGLVLVTSTAVLFSTTSLAADDASIMPATTTMPAPMVKCSGIKEGQTVDVASKEECEKQGGKVVE